jgi:hypothetical protein
MTNFLRVVGTKMNISGTLCCAVTELSKKHTWVSKLFFGKVELRTAKYKTNIYLELSPLNMEFIDSTAKEDPNRRK